MSAMQKLTPQNTMGSDMWCYHGTPLTEECSTCKRMEADEIKAKIVSLGGSRAFNTYTLENFKKSVGNQDALAAVVDFDYAKDNLYLHGPVGSGKSHLAAVAARKFFPVGRKGLFQTQIATYKIPEISRRFRGCDGGEAERELLTEIAGRAILVIEDFGVEKYTEFLVSLMYEIIDWRYQNNPTGLIITSNLSVGDLANKIGDERVASRLVQMCRIVKLSDKDHRFEGKR